MKESEKADRTAGKNLIKAVLTYKRDLTGEDIAFLRGTANLSARELSLKLQLDPSTVSQWETRNTVLSFPNVLAVTIFLFRKLMPENEETEREISNLTKAAYNKDAA